MSGPRHAAEPGLGRDRSGRLRLRTAGVLLGTSPEGWGLKVWDAATGKRQPASRLDRQLEKRWTAGDFIWPAGWEAAYPRERYWWLYGRLK